MTAFISPTPLFSARHVGLRPSVSAVCPRAQRHVRSAVYMSTAVAGAPENPYRIAVLSGDGTGPTVVDATLKVLDEITSYTGIHFKYMHAEYGAAAYEKSGTLVPDETLEICRGADAVLRSYQGRERGVGKDGSAHLQLRDKLGLFAQFRPVIVYPQLAGASTLRPEVVSNTDIMLVREISAGALGTDIIASDNDESRSEIAYTRDQVTAIAEAALQNAEQRSGRILNVDKADVMSVSRFWRKTLHEVIKQKAASSESVILTDMYVDDFVREVILRPTEFDVVVTSNLFGDILAEVIAALAGPQRNSPSFWVTRDGLGVYGPADIYNASAYPSPISAKEGESPIAMIRAASMMLRYGLDEPVAADIVQQSLRKALDDVATPGVPQSSNGNGLLPTVSASEYADVVVRSMQIIKQFEQVCSPVDCGE